MPAVDPLDEFADEQEALIAPLPPTPRAVLFRYDPELVRQDAVAPAPRPRTKPEVVVRLRLPLTRLGATLAAYYPARWASRLRPVEALAHV